MAEKTFRNPLWEDPQTKQRVRARQTMGEGGSADVVISRTDEDLWPKLMAEWTEDEIEANTQEDIKRFREDRKRREEQERDQRERQFQEMLFAEKLAAFEIPEIKASTNKELKRRLRKANTVAQVYVYAAAIVTDGYNSKNNNEEVKSAEESSEETEAA